MLTAKTGSFSKVLILTVLLFQTSARLAGQEWFNRILDSEDTRNTSNFYDIQLKAKEYFKYAEEEYFSRYFELGDYPELLHKNIREYISYKRWEEYWLNHIDSKGLPVSPLTEYREFKNFQSSSTKGIVANWTNINRTAGKGGYWGMGRIREIAFHPTDPNTIWLGADQGGIWKTEDNGDTYTPLGDGLPFLRVSSICVDHTNPDILYMAGGGIGTNYWQRAIGVYKTTDGGQNWTATGFAHELENAKYVRRLVMNPADPSVLLVSTKEGTYRTDNGGDTWTLVNGSESWDMVFHPLGDTVFMGKGSTILSSQDGGLTWTSVLSANESGTFKHLAISPVNNKHIVGQCETGSTVSVYVSTDGGLSWNKKSGVQDTGGTIGFSSSNENTLYRGWTKIYRSTDLGANWQQITHWYYTHSYPEVHADHFRIEKNPHKENTLYFCNDGGMYILDESNMRWTEKSEGLIISQYYSLSSSQSDPMVLLCGSQDNGGWHRKSNGEWETTNGGDGMHTWQSPYNISYAYSSYPGGKIYRTNNGWKNYTSLYDNIVPEPSGGDWNSRFAIDPNNHNRIVSGCFKDVYESLNQGKTWRKISTSLTGAYNLHAITIPEADSDIIYTSSGPYFYYTYNRGAEWNSVYAGGGNTIQEIAVSDYNPKLVWIVCSGYTDGSKVFRSRDGGKSWENISGSLPNISALSVVHRKGSLEDLYVGMTYGIYYRNRDMDNWEFYGHGIPNTEIRDLDIQYSEGKLRSATYGRGLYEADLHPVNGIVPEAGFISESQSVCADEEVQFINTSSDATGYLWNFGDGNVSYMENPSHSYSEEGSYSVRLTAFNDNNTSTFVSETEIRVKPSLDPISLGADINVSYGKVSKGDPVGLIFNVHTPSRLLSVTVYSGQKGTRAFEVLDKNGEILGSVTSYIREGENQVELGIELPVGTDFVLRTDKPEGLFYNYSGASYPYGQDEAVAITGNTEYDPDAYYYFYNWELQYLGCDPGAIPVINSGVNIQLEKIIAYPNPALDNINLRVYGFDPAENISLSIRGVTGNKIYTRNLYTERVFDIDLSFLGSNTGTYIIEIKGERNTATKQILRIK